MEPGEAKHLGVLGGTIQSDAQARQVAEKSDAVGLGQTFAALKPPDAGCHGLLRSQPLERQIGMRMILVTENPAGRNGGVQDERQPKRRRGGAA